MIDDQTAKYIKELEDSRDEYALLLVTLFQHIVGENKDSENVLNLPISLTKKSKNKLVSIARTDLNYIIKVTNQ